MTLAVYAYTRRADGTMEHIKTEHPKTLAGFEVCRHDLWGADVMDTLGLSLLPTLKTRNIEAEGKDLEQLEREVKIVLSNLQLIHKHTQYSEDYIQFRAQNILDAIECAKSLNGGVSID
jgi:hypothetical protein